MDTSIITLRKVGLEIENNTKFADLTLGVRLFHTFGARTIKLWSQQVWDYHTQPEALALMT